MQHFCMDVGAQLTGFISLQDPQERSQAEQVLRVFGQSTEYIAYCKASILSGAFYLEQSDWHAAVHKSLKHYVLASGYPGQLPVGLCPAPCLCQPHQSCDRAHNQVRMQHA